MKGKLGLFISSSIILISAFAIGVKLYQDQKEEKLTFLSKSENQIFAREYSPRYGNPEAKVVITEFLDPECETCREFYPLVKTLMKEYDKTNHYLCRYNQKPGLKTIEWDGKNKRGENLASGVYLYQITSAEFYKTNKMIFLK